MITGEGQPIFLFENDEFNCKKDKTANQYTFIFPKMATPGFLQILTVVIIV